MKETNIFRLNSPTLSMISVWIMMMFFIYQSIAQPVVDWVHRYSGAMNFSADAAKAIAVDENGNAYVTGISFENNLNGDITTIQYDMHGTEKWIDSYNEPASGFQNMGVAIAVQPDSLGGHVFVAGKISHGEQDIILIKYTPAGDREWVKTYSYFFNWGIDGGVDVETDPFGNVYVLGYVTGNGTLFDVATLKYDASGDLLWEKFYTGASATDIPRALAVDNLGNAFVAASSFNFFGSATHDFLTLHYRPDGTEQWVVHYNGPGGGADQPVDIKVDETQNTYVTGYVVGGDGNLDFATIKQNNFGTRLWSATYDGSAGRNDSSVAVGYDQNGNVYITGRSWEIANNDTVETMTTIRYDEDGNEVWKQFHNGASGLGAAPSDLAIDRFGNIYVSGYEVSGSNTGKDYVVIMYDSTGAEQWLMTYDGPTGSNDLTTALAVDHTGSVYVTGYSNGNGSGSDYATIKYLQNLTGLAANSGNAPGEFQLSQNYPNPFNPVTTIQYSLPERAEVKLTIYNLLGQEVTTLVNEIQTSGHHSVMWNGRNRQDRSVSSGTYIYRLQAGERIEKRKMVLIR